MRLNGQRGYILVGVLVVGLLVMIIGIAASKMSDLGTHAYGSEKKYQIASAAAEYAVNEAVNKIASTGVCPSATGSTIAYGGANATYNYFSVLSGGQCFVHGNGTFRGAKITKTLAVPAVSDFDYGAMTLRNGGTVSQQGSAAIVNCNSDCKSPGIVFGGTLDLSLQSIESSAICPNNPRGVYSPGEGIQDSGGEVCTETHGTCTSGVLSDRVPKLFNASSWNDLISKLSGAYNGKQVNVSNLTVGGTPPSVPSSCQVSCTGPATITSATTTVCGKDISVCSSVQFDKAVTVSGLPSTVTTLYGEATVTVTGGLTGKEIVSAGGVTIASGTGNITNSVITTTGSGVGVALASGVLTDSTIVTGGELSIAHNAGTLTDTDVFAQSITMQQSGLTVSGGTIYSQNDLNFTDTVASNKEIGTEAKPVLLLVGGNFDMEHMSGTFEINGLVFVNGLVNSPQNTGHYDINGAIVSNSASGNSVFNSRGNPTISFDPDILAKISTDTNGLFKQPPCGGTLGRRACIANTKITAY